MKGYITNGEHFIDDQDFRFEVRCHCECQTHGHTRRIVLHRRIEVAFSLSESHDLIELLFNFASGHAQNRAVEKDVLSAR